MKEKILEVLHQLGFATETEDNVYYLFQYEGMDMIYCYNENDEDFLSIALPNIMKIEEGKVLQACALAEKVNATLKYVKAYTLSDHIWLFYERELIGNEDLEELLHHMVLRLEGAMYFAHKAMEEIEQEFSHSDDNNDDSVDGTELTDDDDTVTDDDDNE